MKQLDNILYAQKTAACLVIMIWNLTLKHL